MQTMETTIKGNVRNEIHLFAKITADADVAANGYAVSQNVPLISSVARAGEGLIDITLSTYYKTFLGYNLKSSRSGSRDLFVSEQISNTTTPKFRIKFEQAVLAVDFTEETSSLTWTATDPDSATIYLEIILSNDN